MAAFYYWQYGYYPHWATEKECKQIDKDIARMREIYNREGRFGGGWLAAHCNLIDRVFDNDG